MTKLYCVSSTTFDSLKEAEQQLQDWFDEGKLDEDATVYEVSKEYWPNIKLVEIKDTK